MKCTLKKLASVARGIWGIEKVLLMSSHQLSLAAESTPMSGKNAIQGSVSDWYKVGEPV